MQGLLLKLSTLDADIENAVRIISFFDSLIERRPRLEDLLRDAATVAECAVGLQQVDGEFALRALPDGAIDAGRAPRRAPRTLITSDHEAWISRSGAESLPLDDMLLERLGLALIAALGREATHSPGFGDPALLELLLAATTGAPERSRALHLLGLTPATTVTFVAVRAPDAEVAALCAQLAESVGRMPRSTPVGSVHAVVLLGPPPAQLPISDAMTAGVGPTTFAIDASKSWDKALRALRYATARGRGCDPAARPVVRASELGAFELLAARLRSDDIREVADIEILDELSAEPQGADLIRTLEVVVQAGSIREAARKLFLHHNSVSGRLARAEERLGFRVTEPSGIARVGLALALRRLRETDLLA